MIDGQKNVFKTFILFLWREKKNIPKIFNILLSCSKIAIVNPLSSTHLIIFIYYILSSSNRIGSSNNVTLVLDGKSLEYTLLPDLRKDFIDVCISCKAVVCCRVSPSQKAEMVKLVREHTKVCLCPTLETVYVWRMYIYLIVNYYK